MKLLFENWRRYLKEYVSAPLTFLPGNNIQPQGKKFADEREDIEEDNSFPHQIYCDMDGVLVDLIGEVLQKSQNDPRNENLRKGVAKLIEMGWSWKQDNPRYQKALQYINNIVSNNVDFWATLPDMPDKNVLWGYISQFQPIILSHPWDKASAQGKRLWIQNMLSPQPVDVILTGDKHLHAVNDDGSPNILIDDFEKYIVPWEQNGGIAILHTSAHETIKKLEELR